MALAEIIPKDTGYSRVRVNEEIVPKKRFLVLDGTTNATNSKKAIVKGYSRSVRMSFLCGVAFILLSAALSLVGAVLGKDFWSISGAVSLAIGLLFLVRWIEKAYAERNTKLAR